MTITDLRLTGMSCASCAAKIEGGLNRLDGVAATVNFAVEQAHVEHDPAMGTDALIRAVASTGYRASVIDHAHRSPMNHDGHMNHGDHMDHGRRGTHCPRR